MPIAVVRVVVHITVIAHIEHVVAVKRIRHLFINYPLLIISFILYSLSKL